MLQDSLSIPPNLARVTDAYWPDPQTPLCFILIQDIHQNPQAQDQIASLIELGYDAWGSRKVFLEGAFTALDMTVFHRVPTKTRRLLMQHLMEDGDLSGPEIAAVVLMEREWRNPPVSPFQIFGMEDPDLYRQNVLAYQLVLKLRDRALQQLVNVRRLQDSMQLPDANLLHEQLERTEDLLHLKLTPAEYADFQKEKEAIPSSPIIDPAIHAAQEFYRIAQLRSEVFLKEAAKKVPASEAPRILVVGGFHTAWMAERLRQEGRPFVVLSPIVSEQTGNPLYEKRLRNTANLLASASQIIAQ